MLTDMVDQCLLKGLSKRESLELSFDLSQNGEMSQNGRPETALTKRCHTMACLITVGLCLKVDWADPKQPQVSNEVPSKLQHILVRGEVQCSPIQDDLPANCSISWCVERSDAALYRMTYQQTAAYPGDWERSGAALYRMTYQQ